MHFLWKICPHYRVPISSYEISSKQIWHYITTFYDSSLFFLENYYSSSSNFFNWIYYYLSFCYLNNLLFYCSWFSYYCNFLINSIDYLSLILLPLEILLSPFDILPAYSAHFKRKNFLFIAISFTQTWMTFSNYLFISFCGILFETQKVIASTKISYKLVSEIN